MIVKFVWLSAAMATMALVPGSPASGQTSPDCEQPPLVVADRAPAALTPDCLTGPRAAANIPTWKTITIGTYKNVDRLRDDFEAARITIGDAANEVLGRPAFTFTREKTEVDLVVVSAADLGFDGKDASLAEIYTRAAQVGLELCAPDIGPQLRMQYRNQPVGEFLHIAMKPLKTYAGDPIDFTVANGGAGLALIGGEHNAAQRVSRIMRFVFVRSSQTASR